MERQKATTLTAACRASATAQLPQLNISEKEAANLRQHAGDATTINVEWVVDVADNNLNWFLQINHSSHTWVPSTMSALITELGNGAIVGALAVILLIRHPSLAKRVLFATLLTAILMYGAKAFFAAPRPASLLALSEFYIIGDILKKKSFPSGHTTTAFALAGVILLSFQHRLFRLCVLLLAVAAAWSRIAVGAHWPEDVFMGAALGLCIAGLAGKHAT